MEPKDRNLNVHVEDFPSVWYESPGDRSVVFREDPQPVMTPAMVLLDSLSTVRLLRSCSWYDHVHSERLRTEKQGRPLILLALVCQPRSLKHSLSSSRKLKGRLHRAGPRVSQT